MQIKSNFLFKNKHDNIFPKSAFHSATGFTSLKSSNRDKALRYNSDYFKKKFQKKLKLQFMGFFVDWQKFASLEKVEQK